MVTQQVEYHKYEVDIEGAYKPWDKDTITPEEVAHPWAAGTSQRGLS